MSLVVYLMKDESQAQHLRPQGRHRHIDATMRTRDQRQLRLESSLACSHGLPCWSVEVLGGRRVWGVYYFSPLLTSWGGGGGGSH